MDNFLPGTNILSVKQSSFSSVGLQMITNCGQMLPYSNAFKISGFHGSDGIGA